MPHGMYPNTIVPLCLFLLSGQLPAVRMARTPTLELSRLYRSLADPAPVAMICKVNV